MSDLKFSHVYKVYPNGVKAVNDFTMDIKDKEFVVFVGPSGCGKSTTLRMIAGLEEITVGELRIDGKVVNDVEPKDRDIAMVFQNYALYPHMTVYQNMAFGLKLRRAKKDEIDRRVKEAAEILGITEYLDRKPKAMSGGQRQRVALGRAIVREPKVFLLDEPLSNLDAKLRTTMRSEISKLHKKLQTTFVYVTHDQVEAMTMGTRIVVMKDGFIQQIDSPKALYKYPCNKFVAGFIGTPQMNFYGGTMEKRGDKVEIVFDKAGVKLSAPYSMFVKADVTKMDGKTPLIFGLRAEHISHGDGLFRTKCKITGIEELGVDSQIYADFDLTAPETVLETPTKITFKAESDVNFAVGDVIDISLDLEHLHIFDAATEKTIAPRIPEDYVIDAVIQSGKIELLGCKLDLPKAIGLSDGRYKMTVPESALLFGKSIPVTVEGEEMIGEQKLVEVTAGDRVLFVLADGEEKKAIDIDFKKCSFCGDNGKLSAMCEENVLSGRLVRERVSVSKNVDGKVKNVSQTNYYLDACGVKLSFPIDRAERATSAGYPKNTEYNISFSPYETEIAADGIRAEVLQILDYGREKFVKCSVGDNVVYIRTDADLSGTIYFMPSPDKLSLIDKYLDIRII